MMILLTKDDLSTFSQATRDELLGRLFPQPQAMLGDLPAGFSADDFEGVVDLSSAQVNDFMDGCSAQTIAGLRVIAENGPAIHAGLLEKAGIDNFGHFQGRVTKRTRTVTGRKGVFLLAWDDWYSVADNVGHYAVTPTTHRSLRSYFKLD